MNPFGTDAYNAAVQAVLEPAKRPDTDLVVENLAQGPKFYRHIYVKTLTAPFVVEHILEAEKRGFDGVFVGCSYDPGVKEAQELVEIPVIGGLIPSIYLARQLGQKFGFITDTQIGAVNTYDLFKMSQLEVACVGIRATDWSVADVEQDPQTNYQRVIEVSRDLMEAGADVIVLGCTVTSAFFIQSKSALPEALKGITFLDSNICSLKTLELLVELKAKANVAVSRKRYYVKPRSEEIDNINRLRQLYRFPTL